MQQEAAAALGHETVALLAVRHNHRAFARGAHFASSPLQLSGLPDAPTDWLVALGYSPRPPRSPRRRARCQASQHPTGSSLPRFRTVKHR